MHLTILGAPRLSTPTQYKYYNLPSTVNFIFPPSVFCSTLSPAISPSPHPFILTFIASFYYCPFILFIWSALPISLSHFPSMHSYQSHIPHTQIEHANSQTLYIFSFLLVLLAYIFTPNHHGHMLPHCRLYMQYLSLPGFFFSDEYFYSLSLTH